MVDNGASHCGQSVSKRLEAPYPNAIMVHTPVHASWLNPIEISCSIMQRKVLTPNDFESLAAVADRLKSFTPRHHAHPKPCNGTFDRQPLGDAMTRRNKRRVERGEEPLEMAEQPTAIAERPIEIAA